MKVEYVCVITLDQRDVRLASANGGMEIPHPVPPVKTIIKVSGEIDRPRLMDAKRPAQSDQEDSQPAWGVSAADRR